MPALPAQAMKGVSLTPRRASMRSAARPQQRARVVTTRAEIDGTTVGAVLSGVAGVACGLGIPIFFAKMEARDKERLEEIRETNRANLKATGETLSSDELSELRPQRYLDQREFVDDD